MDKNSVDEIMSRYINEYLESIWVFNCQPPEEKFPKIKPISRVKKELVKVDY